MTFEIVNAVAEQRWNHWLVEHEAATIFHTAEWARVLSETYHYTPHYGVLRSGGSVVGMLPVMEVASILTGRRGVSLPFSDECAPLLRGVSVDGIVERMADFGRRRSWDYLELRGESEPLTGSVQSDEYVTHRLSLESTEDSQFKKLKASHRRNIRSAYKQGVDVRCFDTRDAIDTFYKLHCLTRRRHALPPQPLRFFHAIHKWIVSTGYGFVLLARAERHWVAGAIHLTFGARAMFKFGASDPAFHTLRANNLVMWEAIRHFRQSGLREVSLGRTRAQDVGLMRYKDGWGAEKITIHYHRIGLRKPVSAIEVGHQERRNAGAGIVRRIPIPILRLVGSLAYRHVG